MTTKFLIKALFKDLFKDYLFKNEQELIACNATWLTADAEPGYPCRVSLSDAKIGERVLALFFTHHNVNSPYKAAGPIFVRENAKTASLNINEVPELMKSRLLSLRAYNTLGYMINAKVIEGKRIDCELNDMLENDEVEYIHIHYANPGCYACSVHRA